MENQEKENVNFELTNVTAHKYQSPSIKNLICALVKFQKLLSNTPIVKDQNKKIGNGRVLKYASLDGILKATRPLLTKCGLIVTQGLAGDFVDTCIYHESGEQMGYLTNFEPMTGNGSNALQNIGGGFTYIKRYTYNALLGICVEDDLDGDDQAPIKQKPAFNEDNIRLAAEQYLKDGTLAKVTQKYHVKENVLVTIYNLARDIKEESNNQAAEVEKIQLVTPF